MRLLFTVFIFLGMLYAASLPAQNSIVIHESGAKDTISRNIYGHFAEHLGRCIYDGFYVGEKNRTIPNKKGIRLDIAEALKKLQIPVLRWPGGCFADNYHWKDGIGPLNKRKHIENVSWGNVREDNSFGTHEFLQLCEMTGAEPYLAVNMGSGTVQEAAEWVQYVNHANGTSELTDMRKQNGRAMPWHVKYWGVGNESWDCGGHMTVDYYINQYRKYATFMTSYSNTEGLFRIAVGPGWEDFNWTEQLMKNIPLKMLDGVSIHHYSVINWANKGSATQFTEEWGGWYNVEPGTGNAFLFQQNSMRDAMIAGLSLNIFNDHADRVRMANLAQCVNVLQAVILTNKEKLVLTPTYHVMEMYKVHQDALLLPITLRSNDYVFGDKKLKAVSASASKDKAGAVHISLVNIDAGREQEVSISLESLAGKKVTGRILRSAHLQDHNTFENQEKIKPGTFNGSIIKDGAISVTMPPFSVVVLTVK
jgi:alpha-N-arabinofuranosidase